MSSKSYVIRLLADGEVRMLELDEARPSFAQLQDWVGGYVEAIPAKHGVLIVNMESQRDALPVNEAATEMLRSDIRDVLRGDAVLLRQDGNRLVGLSELAAQRIVNAVGV